MFNSFKKLFSNKQKFACTVIENLLKKNNITEYKHYTVEGIFFYEIEDIYNTLSLTIDTKRIYIIYTTYFRKSKAEINIEKRTEKSVKDSIEFYLDDDLKKFGLLKEILENV